MEKQERVECDHDVIYFNNIIVSFWDYVVPKLGVVRQFNALLLHRVCVCVCVCVFCVLDQLHV